MSRLPRMTGIVGFVLVLSTGIENVAAQCPTPPSGFDCKCNADDTKWVCADWSQGAAPAESSDFIVDYLCDGCSDAPEIKFATADDGWELYSEVISSGAAADLGDVLLASDVSPNDGDFHVTIKNGAAAGALNVTSIVLDSTDVDWTGVSNLGATTIDGHVTGAITLVDDGAMPDPQGGEVTGLVLIGWGIFPEFGGVDGPITITKVSAPVSILGSVVGPITITKVSALVAISGDYGKDDASHNIDIGVIANNGGFTIGGNIVSDEMNTLAIDIDALAGSFTVGGSLTNSNATVTIQNMADTGNLTMGTLAGWLELMNGIPSSCPVPEGGCPLGSDSAGVIVSDLTGTGVIDLNGADMAGILGVRKGQNNSRIIAGGAVSGILYPGEGSTGFFNGTVTVSSVSATGTAPGESRGEIEAFLGAALNGTVIVNGINAGLIEASGPFTGQINVVSVAASGVIETAQSALGNIVVRTECAGAIEIGGDLTGTVDIHGALTSAGSVTVVGALKAVGPVGAKILVDGICDGSIQIGEQTDKPTLIHLSGGLGEFGTIEINTTQGKFNAEGDIHIGSSSVCPALPPDITFDGCIRIYDDNGAPPKGGSLKGALTVCGCHSTAENLNICIDGDDNGNVSISQNDCHNQVDWSCSGCPS